MSSGASGGAVGLTVSAFAAEDGAYAAVREDVRSRRARGRRLRPHRARPPPLGHRAGLPGGGGAGRGSTGPGSWSRRGSGPCPPCAGPTSRPPRGRVRPGARAQLDVGRHALPHAAEPGRPRPHPRPAQLPHPERGPGQHRPAAPRCGPAARRRRRRCGRARSPSSPPGSPTSRPPGSSRRAAPRARAAPTPSSSSTGATPTTTGWGRSSTSPPGGSGRCGPTTPRSSPDGATHRCSCPSLVYLDNGSGSDLQSEPAGADQRGARPAAHQGRRDGRPVVAPTPSCTARWPPSPPTGSCPTARSPVAADAGGAPPAPPAVCAALDTWRGPPVKVFYQPTRPSIAAPLGWVLSDQSLLTLTCARDDQVVPSGLPAISPSACRGQAAVSEEGVSPGPVAPASVPTRPRATGRPCCHAGTARCARRCAWPTTPCRRRPSTGREPAEAEVGAARPASRQEGYWPRGTWTAGRRPRRIWKTRITA